MLVRSSLRAALAATLTLPAACGHEQAHDPRPNVELPERYVIGLVAPVDHDDDLQLFAREEVSPQTLEAARQQHTAVVPVRGNDN